MRIVTLGYVDGEGSATTCKVDPILIALCTPPRSAASITDH